MTTDPQPAHLARTVLLASVSFALAAGAHLVAGGTLPTPVGLALCAVPTLLASALVALARARLWVLLLFFAAVQTFLHHGFGLLAACERLGHGPSADLAHGLPFSVPELLAMLADPGHHLVAESPPMLACHGAAAVATSAVIVLAERGARLAVRLWAAILPALAEPFRPIVPGMRRLRAVVVRPDVLSTALARATADPRRGPPAGPAVV